MDYDHELGPEASRAMEAEEGRILSKLGWKGKGLIHATAVAVEDGLPHLIIGKAGKFVRGFQELEHAICLNVYVE